MLGDIICILTRSRGAKHVCAQNACTPILVDSNLLQRQTLTADGPEPANLGKLAYCVEVCGSGCRQNLHARLSIEVNAVADRGRLGMQLPGDHCRHGPS